MHATQLGPGVFTLRNAIYLRSGVHLRGCGSATVLQKAAGYVTRIVRDSDWYENVVEVEDVVRRDCNPAVYASHSHRRAH